MTSTQNQLKNHLKLLENVFPKNNGQTCFRIVSSEAKELVSEFTDFEQKKYRFVTNFTDEYPTEAPIWFTETDDENLVQIVESLSTTNGEDNLIINQVKKLITKLCQLKSMPLFEFSQLNAAGSSNLNQDVECTGDKKNFEGKIKSELNDDDDDDDDDDGFFVKNTIFKQETEPEKKFQKFNFQTSAYGSTMANSRLMKEYKEIILSDTFNKGIYSVELKNDCLYEWNVYLYKVDEDSDLFKDMKSYKENNQKDHLLFNFTFQETFPFDPPFVRLVYPMIKGGFVMKGGALCMELLTKQGWSSVYCIESVILQIASMLVKGKARIDFQAPSTYSLQQAKQSFNYLTKMHEKVGWKQDKKGEG